MKESVLRRPSASRLTSVSGAAAVAVLVGCTPMSERQGPAEIVHFDAAPYLDMSCGELTARMREVGDADFQAATGGDPYYFNNPFHQPDNETLARTRGEMATLGTVMHEKGCTYEPPIGRIGY